MTLSTVFQYILLLLTVTSARIHENPSGRSADLVDCSVFQNDHQILSFWQFQPEINPRIGSLEKTYARMDADENVYELNVFNESSVPSTVVCFEHLKKVGIRRTSFPNDRIPAEIERLAPTLTHLRIVDTFLASLAEQIGSLSRLEWLELVNTGLKALPDSTGNLKSLIYLHLSNNKLEAIPTTIVNIPFLRQVDVRYNPTLRSIQPLNDHPYLRIIQADHCAIEHIPVNLPQLTDLYMTHNRLANLINIRTLGYETDAGKYFYFDDNLIESIPPQIQFVHNLVLLNVNKNQLTTLPADIYLATTLRYLMIANNFISTSERRAIVRRFRTDNPLMNLSDKPQRTSSI